MPGAARIRRRAARDSGARTATNGVDVVGGSELAALVERAREGDGEAWEVLYRRAYPRLLAYARRRLPSDEQARDAVSETVTRAVAGIHRFRADGAGFDAWLYGILRHVVLDLQARSRREGPGQVPDAVDLSADPGADVVHSEELAEIRAAFARLSADDRELLELRVVGGLSSDQVAAVLGRNPGAVRMAQSRALARLRRLLDREEERVVA